MPIRSECIKKNVTGKTRRREEGNVLALLLGTIVILGLIGTTLFETGNSSRQSASQTLYRDRAVGDAEINLQSLRLSATSQLESQAFLNVASLDVHPSPTPGTTEYGYYKLDLQAQAAAPHIVATQMHATTEALSAPDDPFRGSAAVVNTLTVTVDAQSTLPGAESNRFTLPSMTLTPQLSIRQIPLSQFTLFSSATASLELSPANLPVVGRIHTQGDLVIAGGQVASLYPVTAGGNISLADKGVLFAQSGPGEPACLFAVQSTTDNNWLAMARSIGQSTILSGRDLPMTTAQATDVTTMMTQLSSTLTTPAGAPMEQQPWSSGSTGLAADDPQIVAKLPGTLVNPTGAPIEQQELWRQCDRLVVESGGKITATTGAGLACGKLEKRAYRAYLSKHYPNGIVIVVNVRRVAPTTGKNSFYIGSLDANRIVLLTNAGNLTGDLSIITSLPVAVEGPLNVTTPSRAVSITAPSVFGVPAGW